MKKNILLTLLVLCCCTPSPPKVFKYNKGDIVQLKTGEPCIIVHQSHILDYGVRITTPIKGSNIIWVYEYELQDSK